MDAVRADPAGTAKAALAAAGTSQPTLAEAMTVLGTLVAAPGFAGLTVCELNPDHGDPDGSTVRALSDALVAALVPG